MIQEQPDHSLPANWLDRYIYAHEFALLAHDGQRRKFVNYPYVVHPFRVGRQILQLTGDLRLATAGVLHDVLEDTHTSQMSISIGFTDDVALLVASVTKRIDLPKNEREAEYLERFSKSNRDTVLIKLVDRLDNIQESVAATPQFKYGYVRNTIQLLEAIPVDVKRDQFVSKLLREITDWTVSGRIERP